MSNNEKEIGKNKKKTIKPKTESDIFINQEKKPNQIIKELVGT